LVATKKSIMYVACGVAEPVQSQPIYGRTFGGLYSGRWYHPNHATPYHTRPYKGAGRNTYRVDHHYHGRPPLRDGASLRYNGKHFSVNAESTNVR
jgi:hypothetical protein